MSFFFFQLRLLSMCERCDRGWAVPNQDIVTMIPLTRMRLEHHEHSSLEEIPYLSYSNKQHPQERADVFPCLNQPPVLLHPLPVAIALMAEIPAPARLLSFLHDCSDGASALMSSCDVPRHAPQVPPPSFVGPDSYSPPPSTRGPRRYPVMACSSLRGLQQWRTVEPSFNEISLLSSPTLFFLPTCTTCNARLVSRPLRP